MRRIVIWTEADISGLAETWGLSRILTEVDEQGEVIRELGYDQSGKTVHRYPDEPPRATRGVFDLAKIAFFNETEMNPADFDELWSA